MHFYSAVNVTHWGLEPKSTPGNLPACTGSEIHVSDFTDVISQTHRPWFSFRLFAASLDCVRCKFGMSRVLSFCFHPGDRPPLPLLHRRWRGRYLSKGQIGNMCRANGNWREEPPSYWGREARRAPRWKPQKKKKYEKKTVLFCLFLIIHAQGESFLPFVFSSRTGARATYACAHARCVCLHCNCAEMQGSLFVYADTHTCVRQSPVQKIKNAAPQISRARSGRVFSPVQIKGRKEA